MFTAIRPVTDQSNLHLHLHLYMDLYMAKVAHPTMECLVQVHVIKLI